MIEQKHVKTDFLMKTARALFLNKMKMKRLINKRYD